MISASFITLFVTQTVFASADISSFCFDADNTGKWVKVVDSNDTWFVAVLRSGPTNKLSGTCLFEHTSDDSTGRLTVPYSKLNAVSLVSNDDKPALLQVQLKALISNTASEVSSSTTLERSTAYNTLKDCLITFAVDARRSEYAPLNDSCPASKLEGHRKTTRGKDFDADIAWERVQTLSRELATLTPKVTVVPFYQAFWFWFFVCHSTILVGFGIFIYFRD